MPCAQHLAPLTVSSAEGKYDIIEPFEHYHISLMVDVC